MALLQSAFSHRILHLVTRGARNEFFPNVYVINHSMRWVSKSTSQDISDGHISSEHSPQHKDREENLPVEDLVKFSPEDQPFFPKASFKSKYEVEDLSIFDHDNPDSFGNLSGLNSLKTELYEGDEGDKRDDEYVSFRPQRLPQRKYADLIKKLLDQRRFADALNILNVKMLKEDKVKPEYYIYGILIKFCGNVGYTKMAFKLFNEMKKRQLVVTPSIYTSLFNACSNSPYCQDGLTRAKRLRTHLFEKNILPTDITCHAMMKAFGRCGDLAAAFEVADYMMEKKMKLKCETFSFLLQSCISDKEAGFRHALLVFRKMNEYRIHPDVYIFNLLLRCVRDTHIGDFDCMVDVLLQLGVNSDQVKQLQNVSQKHMEVHPDVVSNIPMALSASENQVVDGAILKNASVNFFPNLLAYPPTLGSVMSLSDLKDPHDRFFLLGGLKGFMNEMKRCNAKPDIKTAALLLGCIPPTCDAENALIAELRDSHVQLSIGFYNVLIKRRAFRKQYKEAKDVVALIGRDGENVDLITYGSLAMTCQSPLQACELIKSMEEAGLRPNIIVVSAFMRVALHHFNYNYIQLVFEIIAYEEMSVNSHFIKMLDRFYEKSKNAVSENLDYSKNAMVAMKKFCANYPKWKKLAKIEDEQKNPWEEFRQVYPAPVSDDEFLTECVETSDLKHLKSVFPRKGPKTSVKLRAAKIKRLKEEQPELFQKKANRQYTGTSDGVQGIGLKELREIKIDSST